MSVLGDLNIKDLRHRVTFQSLSNSSDGQGGYTTTWANLATNPTVWGYVKPISSRERLYSNQIQYQRSHYCVIRYRSDITHSMRMTFDSRTFQIKGVRRDDERRFFLILDLEENQGS